MDASEQRKQAEALVRHGMERHSQGDLAQAAVDFTAALTILPAFPEALNNRAVVRHALGDCVGAMTDFDQSLRLRPSYAEAYNNRAVTRHAQRDFAGALADCDMAIRLKPDYAEAYNNRGAARQALRDREGSLSDFDMAIRLKPDYPEAFDNRGYAHYLLWHHAQAVADCDRALALYRQRGVAPNPVLCRLYVCRGDASYHDGNAAGLLANYRQAFQLEPKLACQLVVERLARDLEANARLVFANCDKHLRENPNDFIAFARRGLVWLLLGNDAEGQADLARFYEKHPKNPLGLVKALSEEAQRYRVENGPVQPGESLVNRPPGTA